MTATGGRIRPMTPDERAAVALHDQGRSVEEICDEIGLTRLEVAAAIELRDRFGTILDPIPDTLATAVVTGDSDAAAEPPAVERPASAQDETAAVDVEQAPAVMDETARSAVADDIAALLDAADASPQTRARELATQARDAIATLRILLPNDEKVRKLNAYADVLRKHLAETEAELAALLDGGTVTADDRPVITVEVEPVATEPVPAVTVTPEVRNRLAYSQTVRIWAQDNGWELGTHGRMPVAVVNAYLAANPTAHSQEEQQ